MYKKPQMLDEVCENIRGSAGLSSFHFIKFDKMSKDDKSKVEDAFLDMMKNFNIHHYSQGI